MSKAEEKAPDEFTWKAERILQAGRWSAESENDKARNKLIDHYKEDRERLLERVAQLEALSEERLRKVKVLEAIQKQREIEEPTSREIWTWRVIGMLVGLAIGVLSVLLSRGGA